MKPRHKPSEVGVIPGDWDVKKLGDIAAFRTGPFGTVLHKSDYTEDGIPVINPAHIIEGRLVPASKTTITETAAKQLAHYQLEEGDILVARRGEAGRCAVVRAHQAGWLCGTGSMIVRGYAGTTAEFYQRVLSSPRVVAALEDASVGSTMINLNTGSLAALRVQYPPPDEQRAIAEALSDVDALIESLDQLIAKKRDIKRAAMQQLLTGLRRLPGFSGEWEVKRLEDFGSCLRGVSYRGDSDLFAHDTNSSVRLFRSNNVKNGVVVTTDLQYVSRDRVSESQFMRQDDILVCMANGSKDLVGKSGRFDLLDGYQYTFGAFMGVFRTENTKADPSYVFFLFQTAEYRRRINNLLAGSSINNLRPSSIESLEVRVPPRPEQLAIAGVLKDIEAELAAVEQRRDKTRSLKQGMMQELLTGRTRLI